MKTFLVWTIFLALGAMFLAQASAAGDCICTQEVDYVCGKDGNTYGNPCRLQCAGVGLAYKGCCRRRPSSGKRTC